MISASILADKLLGFLARFGAATEQAALDSANETVSEIKSQMSVPGAAITYPVQWDSDKQRRYVMAKLRSEGNLPYRRTDGYINGWRMERMPEGVSLSNRHPAGAIGGTLKGNSLADISSWQSRIHRGRWPALLPVLRTELAKLPKRIMDKLTVTAK